ncbi:MAG: hypothetical protein K0Q53_1030, partial [Massilibacillus sp.]|nr:hypothetical protein [Massilibacillus sp.]
PPINRYKSRVGAHRRPNRFSIIFNYEFPLINVPCRRAKENLYYFPSHYLLNCLDTEMNRTLSKSEKKKIELDKRRKNLPLQINLHVEFFKTLYTDNKFR